MRPVVLWSDALLFLLLLGFILWLIWFRKTEKYGLIKKEIRHRSRYLIALIILVFYSAVGFIDTLHFKETSSAPVKSVLDILLSPHDRILETTYSAPFATTIHSSKILNSYDIASYPDNNSFLGGKQSFDISLRILAGVLVGILFTFILYKQTKEVKHSKQSKQAKQFNRTLALSLAILFCLIAVVAFLLPKYHILGTDKVGRDVFYLAIKSIRTGLVIGTVTTLVMLPFALLLGMWAGYFRGWVDDVIQYLYTTLSSIPGILLIAAAMLSFQVKIEADPDLRLLILCAILGITSWTTLCRLLRGETLKLRELDFVQSAYVLGVKPLNIVRKHIMPNLMHIVIITVVLDFSSLVLAEAVLSYLGVGVDPVSYSWGNLINASRLDMARDPIVWWTLFGALSFMFMLVFSANIFSDALQAALNPKLEEEQVDFPDPILGGDKI